jgi:Ca2+-binding RTX toxin-like protein
MTESVETVLETPIYEPECNPCEEKNPCDTDYKISLNRDGTLNVVGGEVCGNDTKCVTVKDSGGCDTFDFSCIKGPVEVDLKEQTAQVGCAEIKLECDSKIEKVIGTKCADKIAGDCEDNTIIGGRGGDCLSGGDGCDTFKYNSVLDSNCKKGWDTIKDFECGRDKIDLSCIDANTRCKGDQDFKWIDDAKFSHKAGQLQFKDGWLKGDVNGDCKVDFKIHIPDAHLTVADLVL